MRITYFVAGSRGNGLIFRMSSDCVLGCPRIASGCARFSVRSGGNGSYLRVSLDCFLGLLRGNGRDFMGVFGLLLNVSAGSLQSSMDRLNHRPRKSLKYGTPHEVFHISNTTLTCALNC